MRQLFLTVAIGACLSGCGFTPLYESNTTIFNTTAIELVIKGEGYIAHQARVELKKLLVTIPVNQPYKLAVNVGTSGEDIGYGRDATIQRSQTISSATYTLIAGDYVLHEGSAQASASYSIDTNEEFASSIAADAAQKRSTMQMAQEIIRDVARIIDEYQKSSDPHPHSKHHP